MKRLLYTLLLLLMVGTIQAQEGIDSLIDIDEVAIVGRRAMKQIGVQRTEFDAVALQEHIALSMADVLTYNSSIFVKSYGRATLSTVAFRGTSPSHTQVLWNGMKINSPMLGMTDFSMIPSYFIDEASLLHGSSSVSETGGGLGGAVKLATRPKEYEGFHLQFVQGIGSFSTFDEYLQLGYGNNRWQLSTRLVYATSPNDYKYVNRDKKLNIYDENHNIIDQYHPTERNRNGAFKDFHALQEIYYRLTDRDRLSLTGWYTGTNRELPMISTSYAENEQIENRQREETLRALLGWEHIATMGRIAAQAGYIHSWSAYDRRITGAGMSGEEAGSESNGLPDGTMEYSRNRQHTLYGNICGEYLPSERWLFSGEMTAYHHINRAVGKEEISNDGTQRLGLDKERTELTATATARWRATPWFGVGLTLREELYGEHFSPLIPALFLDGELIRGGKLVFKGSCSRNYRFPTLTDLYFQPGGNPNLRPEKGWSYDFGMDWRLSNPKALSFDGSLTWFDSHIEDWIMWYPKAMGYYTPANVKKVHSYGIEIESNLSWKPNSNWLMALHGSYAWTPSLNEGEPFSSADRSVGKQLPYVPEHSASATLRAGWRRWELNYKWCVYSERYALSSNGASITGTLDSYALSNISLARSFAFTWCDLSLRGAVNNLFNKEYVTVLSRPMPGINYEIFIGITPKWGKGRN
ncbi:MAG: TonB-dependent receptor [Alistipes sp.]|nr:TonB-dependent receptor [Alistipes sp.]